MNDQGTFRNFMESKKKHPQAAGVIPLSTRTGKILLCKRAKGQDHAGTWCGFGGMMEAGESPEEAALRELREEAGIPETKVSLLKSGVYLKGELRFHQFVGLVDFPDTWKPSPGKGHKWEVADAAWVPPEDARKLGELHPGLDAVLRKEGERLERLDRRPHGE